MITTMMRATAAAAAALIGLGPQALANAYLKNVLDAHPVTKTLRSEGVMVAFKQTCSKKNLLGQFLVAGGKKAVVLCLDSINGDSALALETLKHEAIHVAQFCYHNKFDSIYPAKVYKEIAKKKGFDIGYATKMAEGDESEFEAYWLEDAHDKVIVEFINDHCNDKELTKEIEKV